MSSEPRKIGLITTISLVVGNMIGVGIFVLPAALASYGSISLLGWVFTSIGAMILAKIFSNLSKIVVNKSGGPYAYTREAFGDFIGFLIAWGYWIACWVGNGAITIAVVGALSFFFPELETNSLYQVSIGLRTHLDVHLVKYQRCKKVWKVPGSDHRFEISALVFCNCSRPFLF